MRLHPQGLNARSFESIATSLGRKLVNRGKEPNWEKDDDDPKLMPPLSIPHHGGKDYKIGTSRSVIDSLLNDVDVWDIYLQSLEEIEDGGEKHDEQN